jgi:hypothetical protein
LGDAAQTFTESRKSPSGSSLAYPSPGGWIPTPRSDAKGEHSEYMPKARTVEKLAEWAFCYVKQHAPQDIQSEGTVRCDGKGKLFKEDVVDYMKTSRNERECLDHPDLEKIIVAIAEVVWVNQNNSMYTPGSAVPIATHIVCEKMKAKGK